MENGTFYGIILLLNVLLILFIVARALKALERSERSAEEMRHHKIAAAVMRLACPYNPLDCESTRRFLPLKNNSDCLFAKAANLWGSRDWDSALSLEQNIERSVPSLLQFLLRSKEEDLDGFVIELRGLKYGRTPMELGKAVKRALVAIDNCDPAKEHCMRKRWIGARGWSFSFARVPIFVTTFAPCYSESSARHMFGARVYGSSFVLLQPEASFLRRELPRDHAKTSWVEPRTIRDRIRRSFRDHGRAYFIPPTISYPPAEHIVRPLGGPEEHENGVVQWWKGGNKSQWPTAIALETDESTAQNEND